MESVLKVLLCLQLVSSLGSGQAFSEDDDRPLEDLASLQRTKIAQLSSDYFYPCPTHATGPAGEAFTDLLNTLILSECILAQQDSYPKDQGGETKQETVFDFIVVGGGTAGAVLASRLSEVNDWKVLLLEAGGNPTMTTEVPKFHLSLQRTDIDWGLRTVREKGLYNGLMGKTNRWPRGKALGGTSSMGAMLYIRGAKQDYDNIAAAGNPGWSYMDVLPYFKKSEDMRDLAILKSPNYRIYHSRGGPLALSRLSVSNGITDLLQEAFKELGFSTNFDINSVNLGGFLSQNQGTVRGGERLNTAKAFLNPVKGRKNLFIIKHALVLKVLICPHSARAYGVQYIYNTEKTTRVLRASREIILCAGVIGSPKILMQSGVGPQDHLESLGIQVIKNLTVGKNLQDHVMFPGVVIPLKPRFPTVSPLDVLDDTYEYLTRRTGNLSSIGGTELVGFLPVQGDSLPDFQVQFYFSRFNQSSELNAFLHGLGLEEYIALQYMNLNAEGDLLIAVPMLLHPKSIGDIKLKSNNYEDKPLAYAGYLDYPEELDQMLEAIRMLESLTKTATLKALNASVSYLTYRGCCGLPVGSDSYWACALSHTAGTGHNQVGTCKMGPPSDSDAVVDYQLRVHGIRGLRVADSSVIPFALTGSPMAAVIMIGEKAADLIKIRWIPSYQPITTTYLPFLSRSRSTTLKTMCPRPSKKLPQG